VRWANTVVAASWAAYWGVITFQYFSAERERRRAGQSRQRRTDSRSLAGMFLEAVAFALVLGFRRAPGAPAPALIMWLAALLAPLAAALAVLSAHRLGREFRLQAVVTEDHRLVNSGPYRVLRHPIYCSLLILLLATGFTVTQWPALAAAVAIFLAGTEIRIHVEEGLLAGRFGADFYAYRARTAAYIPFVR